MDRYELVLDRGQTGAGLIVLAQREAGKVGHTGDVARKWLTGRYRSTNLSERRRFRGWHRRPPAAWGGEQESDNGDSGKLTPLQVQRRQNFQRVVTRALLWDATSL